MKRYLFITAFILGIFLTSCAQPPDLQQTPAATIPTQATAAPAHTEVPSASLLDEVKNGSIFAPQSQKTVRLQNGTYENSGADYLKVVVLPQSVQADLNGDGKPDAAVLLAESMGGSGTFVSLCGFIAAENKFDQTQCALIDDRPQINSLSAENDAVVLDAVIHGPSDSMASPSMKALETYKVYGRGLSLVQLETEINSAARSIQITTPVEGQEVSGTVEVKGSMPIAPFENTLSYKVYAADGTVLDEGPFMVQAADVGQPATFDNTVALPTNYNGVNLRIELGDLSAKDLSPLCRSSVDVVIN